MSIIKNTLFVALVLICVVSCGGSNEANANTPPRCAASNCHGSELSCDLVFDGDLICTQEYRVGDHCRALASCEMRDGECVVVKSDSYSACIECVKKCEGLEGAQALSCDDECREK